MDETSREAELENYLDALTDFHKKPTKSIPSVLEQLLQRIARLGEPLFPWFKLKPLIVMKLENVIEEYIEYNPHEEVPILPNVENVRFDDMRERLLKALDSFNSAPFTIQRLCELLTEPKRYYRRSDKFMRGIEKNIQVVSTVTPSGKRITSLFDLEKSPPMVNGIVPESDASPSSDNNGFVRPDEAFSTSTSTSTSSSTSGSTSSNSGRADSLNGLSRPFYNSDPMDAPLQFAYPLSQNLTSPVTSMPSTDSSLRTDPSKVNGTHLELQEADAKETSEAVAEPNPQLEEAEKRTSEERMLLADENMEVDVTSEVSSSDTESFSGEPRKKEEGEEMEVDVASSGDGDVGRAGDSGGGDAAKEGEEKDEGEGVSTSESSGASVDTPMDREDSADDAGKADSSEGSKSTAPQQHGEELSANSEAAPSEEQAEEEEERSPAREQAEGAMTDKPSQDEPTTQGEPSQGEPSQGEPSQGEPSEGEPSQREASQAETEIQHSQEASDVNAAGDAPGPADSSNDAKSMQTGVAEENPSGSSEAVSKDGAQETDDQIQGDDSSSRPPSDEDAVESSADATVSTPGEPSAEAPSDKASGSVTDPSSSDSTGDGNAGQPSGEDQDGERAGDQQDQQQQQQPPAQDAVSESTES
ncbi:uncharacterized protein [Diadema antillarum]|uniref:uncharacterized protein n=1 Tax=Diadema antillarum TaxID=105358 RepID=UPI003A8AC72D